MTASNIEIRINLNKFKSNIIMANKNTIDYEVLSLKKFILENVEFKRIYDEQIENYNKLRDNIEFQNIIKDNFDLIIKYFKEIGITINSYEYFTPIKMINPVNTNRELTLLYFWRVDSLINEIIKMHSELKKQDFDYFYKYLDIKKTMCSYDNNLLERNIAIYKFYYDLSCFLDGIKHSENKKDIMISFLQAIRLCRDSYIFFFFDIETNRTQIELIEQIKTASVNIINYYLENIQTSNKSKDVKNIENNDLTKREKEIAALLSSNNLQADEIADIFKISVTTARTHINRILNKKGIHSKKELKNT